MAATAVPEVLVGLAVLGDWEVRRRRPVTPMALRGWAAREVRVAPEGSPVMAGGVQTPSVAQGSRVAMAGSVATTVPAA